MSLPVERCPSPLPLQSEGGDQTLDLGGLAVGLAILALKRAPVGVDVLAHVIILGQVEKLPDLRGSLGTTHARLVIICEAGQVSRSCIEHLQLSKIDCLLNITEGINADMRTVQINNLCACKFQQ